MKLKALSYGILAAFGALALESLILIFPEIPLDSTPPEWFMPVGVFIEEFLSLLIIARLFQNYPAKNGRFGATILFGAGFSLPEIILNVFDYPVFNSEIFLSYLGIFLLHTACSGIIGVYFSKKESAGPSLSFFFLAAFLVHLIFNYLILSNLNPTTIIIWPLIIMAISFFITKAHFLRHSLPIQKK